MSGAADMAGLAEFVPLERRVTLRSGPIEIRPLTLRQLSAFSRAVAPILPHLVHGQIVAAIVENPDALLEAVAAATGIPAAGLPEDPAEFVELAAAVVEVNVDFFIRRLLPADRAAGVAILTAAAKAPDGAPSLPGFVNGATG